jgi:hypothetical protein
VCQSFKILVILVGLCSAVQQNSVQGCFAVKELVNQCIGAVVVKLISGDFRHFVSCAICFSGLSS